MLNVIAYNTVCKINKEYAYVTAYNTVFGTNWEISTNIIAYNTVCKLESMPKINFALFKY